MYYKEKKKENKYIIRNYCFKKTTWNCFAKKKNKCYILPKKL